MSDDNQDFHDGVFKDLKELAESSFPKKCANCGRVYDTAEQFLSDTDNINPEKSGLKESVNDDGSKIVEAFRNCPCGSTLMDLYNNRRDLSEVGLQRRKKFEDLLVFLVANGVERAMARLELLKIMRGEKSEILSKIKPPP